MTGLLASAAPTIHVPHVDYLSILPMLIMLGGALALMLVSSLLRSVMGVRAGTIDVDTVRFVTHHDVDDDDLTRVVDAVRGLSRSA